MSEDGDGDDIVLFAYWLAHTYHQPPDHFLSMPPDEVLAHVDETTRLMKFLTKK